MTTQEDPGRRTLQPHAHRTHARAARSFGAGALTISTSAAAGDREDATGPLIGEKLRAWGFDPVRQHAVTDDLDAIEAALRRWIENPDLDLVVTTGGTGLAATDVTPEATLRVVDRQVPGVAELLRQRGWSSTPLAALSRGVVGLAGSTLIVNLPGSPGGVGDGLATLEPIIVHAVEIASGRH